jgi:hypothetical protein
MIVMFFFRFLYELFMSIFVDPWYDRLPRITGYQEYEEKAKVLIKERFYTTCELEGGLSATTGVHLEAIAFQQDATDIHIMVRSFLRRGGYSEGADEFVVTFHRDTTTYEIHGHYPVHQAIREGDLAKIKRLNRKGIFLHVEDETGLSTLELARQLNKQNIVAFLEKN